MTIVELRRLPRRLLPAKSRRTLLKHFAGGADIVGMEDFEDLYSRAVAISYFSCPTCGAEPLETCKGGVTHAGRLRESDEANGAADLEWSVSGESRQR